MVFLTDIIFLSHDRSYKSYITAAHIAIAGLF